MFINNLQVYMSVLLNLRTYVLRLLILNTIEQ